MNPREELIDKIIRAEVEGGADEGHIRTMYRWLEGLDEASLLLVERGDLGWTRRIGGRPQGASVREDRPFEGVPGAPAQAGPSPRAEGARLASWQTAGVRKRRSNADRLAKEVRELHDSGHSVPEIATRVDRTNRTIYRLLKRPLQ